MTDTNLIKMIIENIGFPAVIFAVWYIYHKAQVKTFEQMMNNNFKILKDLLETTQYNVAVLSRIESKIDLNVWCPVLKKEFKELKNNAEY